MDNDTVEILSGVFSFVLIIGLIITLVVIVGQCNSSLKEVISKSASKYECINGKLYEHIKDYNSKMIKKSYL